MHHKNLIAGLILTLMAGYAGNLSAQTTPIGFRLSGAAITEKDTFVVALNADSVLTGRSVFAYRFYLTYSPSWFEFISMEGTGTPLSGWGEPVLNSTNPGTLIMASAGTEALTGSGELIYLKFRSLRSGNAYISFNTTESYLNERNPPAIFVNGYISAAARSYPNIYPDQQNMFIGDEVLMNVSGGQSPYVYASENPAVAQVTDVDKIRAVGPGKTRIRVTDDNGEVSVTTGLFDIRAIRMDIEEVSIWPADTFYIPVKIEVAPGTAVYSGKFDLAFNSGLSGLPGNILPADFPAVIEHNPKTGRISVSFAASSGITGSGVLCYLPFRANSSGNQFVRFENMRFNETLLAWSLKSTYYINVRSLPTLNLVPNSGTMMWGEVLKINVYNGTAPYVWTVSNTDISSIDPQGNLAAGTGGQLRVTATDANGATRTSGIFTISDNQVSVFATDGVLDTETRVPILTSSLPPGKTIYGFRAAVSFDDTYLDYVRAEGVSGGLVQSSLSGNSVELAGAFGQGVSSGIIGFLVFRIKNSLSIDASTSISLNSFSANENSLFSSLENGSIRRVEQASYRPVAIAGLNFSLQEGSTGQLDGTASFDLDNDPLTYRWRGFGGLVLSDTTSPTPEFTAPYVSENTVFTVRLIVNDGTDDSDPSEVNVTVLQVNIRPEANAGPDRNFAEGSSVSLDGSASFDPDGDAISYNWISLDGIVLFNATSSAPSFILPQVSANTSYRFTLVVNDGALGSGKDTVTVTAIQVNKKPVAFAGGDFSLDENEAGALDGSLSFDADSDPLTYKWTAPPQVTLSSSTIANPTFTAPPVLRDSLLSFTLVVNDGSKDSDPDVVLATIINLDSLSMETLIDSVFMAALDSFYIDTTNATVTLYVPYGLDIHSLSPGFTLSKSAFIHPASGSTHDFTMPVYYTVTAEDGVTSRLWSLEVYQQEKTVERTIKSGWNWISLNVRPEDMDIGTLFGGLALSDLDYLKSAEYSSTWYNATGWFGNLSTFPQNRMLKFRKSTEEDLVVRGLEINPAVTSIPLAQGWNDLAYLLRSDESLDAAIESASIPPGDAVLKGLDGSAVYYEGTGWVGELDSLRVLHGYKLNVLASGNLFYNPSAGSLKSIPAKKSIPPEGNNRMQLLHEYGISPEDFEFSATLIAEVRTVDGKSPAGPQDLIIAYHGEEIRGVSRARYVALLDKYLFILTYYSGEDEQEINFSIRFRPENIEYGSDLKLDFRQDMITGEALNPHVILVQDLASGSDDVNGGGLSIYPNPVSEQLTVSSTTALKKIRIYSLTGEVILDMGRTDKTITIPVGHLVPGIYTLEAVTANKVIIRKIIKTSY